MLATNFTVYDVRRTCRSCLSDSGEMVSLQKPNGGVGDWSPDSKVPQSIGELMMECADVQFKYDDRLPQNMCSNCVSELRIAAVFRRRCKESDTKLRMFFLQNLPIVEVKLELSDQKSEIFAEEENVNNPLDDHWMEDLPQNIVLGNDDDSPMFDNDSNDVNVNKLRTRPGRKTKRGDTAVEETTSTVPISNDDGENNSDYIPSGDNASNDKLNGRKATYGDSTVSKHEIGVGEITMDAIKECANAEGEAHALASRAEIVDGRLKCEICERTMANRTSLVAHIRRHTGKSFLFRCTCCQRGFSKHRQLRRHMENQERKLNPEKAAAAKALRDREAALAISSNAFEKLGQPNGEKNCVCKICDASFKRIASLRKHVQSHGAADPLLLNTLSSEQYQITNNGGWELTLSDSETDADDSDGEDDELSTSSHRIHTCGCCKRSYDRRYKLVAHMNFDHLISDFDCFRCSICYQPYPNGETLAKHRRDQCENVSKKITCKKCGVRFQWASSLELHTSQGHQRKTFNCDKCDRKYFQYQGLERHKKIEHADGTSYKYFCDYCTKPFKKRSDYMRHKAIHNVHKLICEICQQIFPRKDQIRKHMKTHIPRAAKPAAVKSTVIKAPNTASHLCIYCGITVSTAYSLNDHLRRHTGERPYKCEICQKSFLKSTTLKTHKLMHLDVRPFPCKYCTKSFATSEKLARHTRIHTGERPYKCAHCEKTFYSQSNHKAHIRTHTGDTPYRCKCGEKFSQSQQLLKHRRRFDHFDTTE